MFALVAKMNITKILLSCAVNLNWDLQQFDVTPRFNDEDVQRKEMTKKKWLNLKNDWLRNSKLTTWKNQNKESLFSKGSMSLDILIETDMLGCKPAESPIESKH
ncbi:DNA polymerase theta [Gossypium australe]|uniref:DNA polymerase theta n=1 Tax=Gossypium australe TaxID=47621 RepID=A0A5B6WEU8_9ROSI|nr:DNA polymerase theta [Gossypium australe]